MGCTAGANTFPDLDVYPQAELVQRFRAEREPRLHQAVALVLAPLFQGLRTHVRQPG